MHRGHDHDHLVGTAPSYFLARHRAPLVPGAPTEPGDAKPLQWQTAHLAHGTEAAPANAVETDCDLVEAAFIDAFADAKDPTSFLRLRTTALTGPAVELPLHPPIRNMADVATHLVLDEGITEKLPEGTRLLGWHGSSSTQSECGSASPVRPDACGASAPAAPTARWIEATESRPTRLAMEQPNASPA